MITTNASSADFWFGCGSASLWGSQSWLQPPFPRLFQAPYLPNDFKSKNQFRR
jgi:hypothetical protein